MRRVSLAILAVVAGVAAVSAAPVATVGFRAEVPLEGQPTSDLSAVFDATGDGKPDVVLAPYSFTGVRIYPGRGDGTFDPMVTVPTSRRLAHSFCHGRLNADDTDDLVLCEEGSTRIEVLLCDGAGGYASATYVAPDALAGEGQSAVLLDWDGDGDLDIFAAGMRNENRVFLNDGTGGFSGAENVTSMIPSDHVINAQAVAADLDGDGDTDLALSAFPKVSVFWRQPDGTFAAGPSVGMNAIYGTLVAADFDGDGLVDLACEELGPGPFPRLVVVRHASPTTFGERAAVLDGPGAFSVHRIAVADLNGDGFPEVVTPTTLFVNDGTGGFPKARALPTLSSRAAAVGDLDLDGTPDLVSAPGVHGTTQVAATVLLVGTPTSNPSVVGCTPSRLFRDTSNQLEITGLNFESNAVGDFGEGISVDFFVVTSPTSIRALVSVAPDAAFGDREFRVENRDGAFATGTFTVAPGGRAVVSSVTPSRAHAGETVDLVVDGFSFVDPLSVSLGDGVSVKSVVFESDQRLRITAELPAGAAPGPRDLAILNGLKLVTVAGHAFTVLAPRSVDLKMSHGSARAGARVAQNRFSVKGRAFFNTISADQAFSLMNEPAEIRIGDAAQPFVFDIEPHVGWRIRGPRVEWHTQKGDGAPQVRLLLDFAKHTFRLDVRQAGIAIPATGDVMLEFTFGDESGTTDRPWTATRGGFVLK